QGRDANLVAADFLLIEQPRNVHDTGRGHVVFPMVAGPCIADRPVCFPHGVSRGPALATGQMRTVPGERWRTGAILLWTRQPSHTLTGYSPGRRAPLAPSRGWFSCQHSSGAPGTASSTSRS